MSDEIDRFERERQTLDASYIRGEIPATEFVPARRAINSQLDAIEAMTDDDAPDIPPALTETEWAKLTVDRPRVRADANNGFRGNFLFPDGTIDVNDVAALMALCNEALRQLDDPRAFTRRVVKALRFAESRLLEDVEELAAAARGDAANAAQDDANDIGELADALESYLPPDA